MYVYYFHLLGKPLFFFFFSFFCVFLYMGLIGILFLDHTVVIKSLEHRNTLQHFH